MPRTTKRNGNSTAPKAHAAHARSKPRQRRGPKPEAAPTVPVRLAGAGSEGVIHHQKIDHRPVSRYVMTELFD